jgi:ABC-type phosphate transport system substrate-binding protein
MKFISLKISLALVVFMAFVMQAGTLEGVAVIANKSVPVNTLSPGALKDIYTGRKTYWEDGQSVVIVVLHGKAEDAAIYELSGMDPSQFKTFWQRMVFTGRGQLPKKVDDTASLLEYVASTKGAIAIVSADADLKNAARIQVK